MRILSGIGIALMLLTSACTKNGISPVAEFDYSPDEGSRYSIFYFDASGSFDPDNATYSLKYRWDFDGDGKFDTEYSEKPKASYKYEQVECYNVVLEVVDPEFNTAEMVREICLSNKNNTPFAIFDLLPPIASLGTKVIMDASRSFDWEEGPDKLLVRWDWDGDKVWDTEFSNEKVTNHLYTSAGYYTVFMEIIDSDGASAISEKILEVANTYNEFNYLTDYRDGQIYGVVKIGEQWIMAQNLMFGTFVKNVVTPRNNGICEVFAYSDIEENLEKYGGLYLWDEILNYTDKEKGQGFCPQGWHLPSDKEWKQLEAFLGMGTIMMDSTGWMRGNGIGSVLKRTGLSGFGGGLYGYRYPYRIFSDIGNETRYWTSTGEEDGSVWVRGLSAWSNGIFRGKVRNNYSYSVRCFKN